MSNVLIAPFVRRHSCCRSETRRGGGFTLLELLIVIGIIALLISLLLPALARTRESAHQVTCEGHLRQLAAAMMAYVNDNDGAFPSAAGTMAAGTTTPPAPNDWIDWQSGGTPAIQNIGTGGLGPYLHLSYGDQSSWSVLRCPSDDTSSRTAAGGNPYPFSYVLNGFFATSPAPSAMGGGGAPKGSVRTLRQVKDPSQKILFYEEGLQTLNDGCGNLMPPPASSGTDLLAVRHDWSVHNKADTTPADTPGSGSGTAAPGVPDVPFVDARGNVVFCDGHADFISRHEAHSKAHYAPDLTYAPLFTNPALP